MKNGKTSLEKQALEISRVFQLQLDYQYEVALTSASQRKAKLKRLQDAIFKYRKEIHDALWRDFRKNPSEVDLTEILPLVSAIRNTRRKLSRWMQRKTVDTPISLFGSRSYIHYEPKGVVLIISPWNFPLNLTFGPLIGAIAAGNCAILKPSEYTPYISEVMKKIVSEIFDEKEVALFPGAVETSRELLKLPFNHIFFTGAPAIGKVIMGAAAQNLASVTLELGGKSPTIIDETANLMEAARRIAWAKLMNSGQICLCPDYLLIHESKKEEFLTLFKKSIHYYYGEKQKDSPDYARIVDNRHFDRLEAVLQEAVESGAKIAFGGDTDPEENFVQPTLLTDVSLDSRIMTEEVFGPILPVLTFKNLEEVVHLIKSKEKPLTLYIYSKNRKNIQYILKNTRAGTTAINHSVVHFFNQNLPFGGVNNSGIGKTHGKAAFEEFSNPRGVFKQILPLSTSELLAPPFGKKLKQKLINFSLKWL